MENPAHFRVEINSMAILGQLDAGGLLNREVPTIHSRSIGAAIDSGM